MSSGPRVSGSRRVPTCSVCDRVFARTEHLNRHLRTHTKEKPYSCHCGRSFTRRDLLTRHERIYHTPSSPGHEDRPSQDQAAGPQGSSIGSGTPLITPASHNSQPSLATDLTASKPTDSAQHSLFESWGGPSAQSGFQPALNAHTFIREGYGDAMLDFSTFMDTVGLDFDLGFLSDPLGGCQYGNEQTVATGFPVLHASSALEPQHEKPRRIPNASIGDDDFHELKPLTQPWQVTEEHRRQFQHSLAPFGHVLGTFTLPSRLSLARSIAGYVDGFSSHHSFIHTPTFDITAHQRTPDTVLAILAIGAQYRYERRNSFMLYNAARSIVLERIRRRDPYAVPSTADRTSDSQASRQSQMVRMETVRTLLLLATYGTFQQDQNLVRESFGYQGLVARYIREDGLSEVAEDDGDDWLEWVRIETDRRTKLCAFCLLNLQTLAYNLPPALLSNEIDLRLPTSCKQWLSRGQAEWMKAREEGPKMVSFKEALTALLRSSKGPSPEPVPLTSPMGNFILMQALIQRMFIVHQLSVEPGDTPFCEQDLAKFEEALDRFRSGWQKSPESVLDLKNSKGSSSFASTALLGLAHVRLHFDLGHRRRLQSGSPDEVARAALEAPLPQRTPRLLQALLHSSHALNIPVQLGVDYLIKCQAFFWGVQHSLCSFECAIFLSKWLYKLASSCSSQPLTELEHQIVRWVGSIVQEAKTSLDDAEEILSIADDMGHWHPPSSLELYHLSIAVVRVFAHMLKRCNSTWPVVEVIGQSLQRYADLLQEAGPPS